jgi:acetyl esterase
VNRAIVPRLTAFAVACALATAPGPVVAQAKKDNALPAPDVRDAKYGPHERNVFDLWQAKSETPTPVVVYIHGGGFRAGDKSTLSPALLARCRESGISVVAINYRLSQQAAFPAPMIDGARAVQFLRSKAKDWNLDPTRVAATGGSAGAGISLWLAFHDDLADPKSDDPVARESTRLTCAAVQGAQSSYDPRWIKEHVGGRAHEHPALAQLYGLKPDEFDTPKAHKLYQEASPINYVSKDDPPVFLFYSESKAPLPADAKPGDGIHHPKFGEALKEKLDALKIECVLRHLDDYKDKPGAGSAPMREMVDFLLRHLGKEK